MGCARPEFRPALLTIAGTVGPLRPGQPYEWVDRSGVDLPRKHGISYELVGFTGGHSQVAVVEPAHRPDFVVDGIHQRRHAGTVQQGRVIERCA